jgi:phage terminase large subunit-like protein
MKVEELSAFVEKHRLDENYQHRDLSDAEFFDKAMLSFNRLSDEHKKKVFKVCKQYDLVEQALIVRARFMAQTNLFFLCKLLGYTDVSDLHYTWTDGTIHNTHEEICNDFFVRKDPTTPSFKQFAMKYIDKKERLLLIPRGCFKSTIDMADSVQWVINFPEVTILILTGILDLAKDFVGEIKGHFTLDDADSAYADLYATKKNFKARTLHGGDPSIFQMLFPEHCIPKDDGKGYEYQTPAVSQTEKECTVFAASIEQSLTGWHVGVMKLDDVVTNENSQTVDRLKNINKQVSINQAMLHPYGFYDKIGTWYDTEDTYGQDIKDYKRSLEDGESFSMKIYIRAAWWPNEAARKLGKIEEEMTEADYDLLFGDPENPHALTYAVLKIKKRDPYFAIKYLNDPTQMHVVKFPRELLIRRTISANLLPGTGMIVSTVDTAYSTQTWADYTVVITALIYGGKFYIIDMQRGRYNEYELPQIIAGVALKWKPSRICIEDNHGRWIGREIYREMDRLKVRSPLEFLTLGKGDKKTNSKTVKAKPVLRYLGDERLLFSNSCPGLDELYDELEKFGTAASTHDDIVDALAILVNTFASYAEMDGKISAAGSEYIGDPKMKSFYDQTYCLGKHSKFNVQEMMMENPQMSPQELIQQAMKDSSETSNVDPFGDLF